MAPFRSVAIDATRRSGSALGAQPGDSGARRLDGDGEGGQPALDGLGVGDPRRQRGLDRCGGAGDRGGPDRQRRALELMGGVGAPSKLDRRVGRSAKQARRLPIEQDQQFLQ